LTSLRLPVLRSVVMHYVIAILAIALALALRLALALILAGEASYLFFLPAILIASALGGLGPGLCATVIGLLLCLFFVVVFRVLSPADIISAGHSPWSGWVRRGGASCCVAPVSPRRQMQRPHPRARRMSILYSTAFPRP
jgi:K+-sensing histidine kinase KdpD